MIKNIIFRTKKEIESEFEKLERLQYFIKINKFNSTSMLQKRNPSDNNAAADDGEAHFGEKKSSTKKSETPKKKGRRRLKKAEA